jgi:prepilin-type N-terminal cleavage/methylation domain-containing protein
MASQPSHDRAAKRQRTQRGLTLLELLVVLTVAALATAAVSLSLRDPDQRALQREGERLAALLESGRMPTRGLERNRFMRAWASVRSRRLARAPPWSTGIRRQS